MQSSISEVNMKVRHHGINTEFTQYPQKRDMDLEVLADSRLAHPQQESPSKVIAGREEQVVLEHAMSLLSEDSRQAITLRHRDNLSFAEIGIRLGKSEDAARKTWARGVEQLKQVLNRD